MVKTGILVLTYCYSYIFCYKIMVYCRIGSLEDAMEATESYKKVYCRIGSLEAIIFTSKGLRNVYYQVGSLEKYKDMDNVDVGC